MPIDRPVGARMSPVNQLVSTTVVQRGTTRTPALSHQHLPREDQIKKMFGRKRNFLRTESRKDSGHPERNAAEFHCKIQV